MRVRQRKARVVGCELPSIGFVGLSMGMHASAGMRGASETSAGRLRRPLLQHDDGTDAHAVRARVFNGPASNRYGQEIRAAVQVRSQRAGRGGSEVYESGRTDGQPGDTCAFTLVFLFISCPWRVRLPHRLRNGRPSLTCRARPMPAEEEGSWMGAVAPGIHKG